MDAVAALEAVVWPAAAVAIAYILRKPLGEVIGDLRQLIWKNGEFRLEFGNKLEEIKEEVGKTEPPFIYTRDIPPGDKGDYLDRLALTSPRAAVIEAWRTVEMLLVDTAERFNLPTPYAEPAPDHFLLRHGAIDSNTASLLHDLRKLRNRTAHAREFDITPEQALEYASIARRLLDSIRQANETRAARDKAAPCT